MRKLNMKPTPLILYFDSLAKARYDTLFEGLKLKAAAGVLSESDVVVVNGLLEP